jgi:hypothetical protein
MEEGIARGREMDEIGQNLAAFQGGIADRQLRLESEIEATDVVFLAKLSV